MKVKVLEYKIWKDNKVKVKSHNLVKGKWKENPKFEFHKLIVSRANPHSIVYKKEYEEDK